jgi:hypothetical protein
MEPAMMTGKPDLYPITADSPGRLAALPFLGPPALVVGEESAAYDAFLARVTGALKPGDILEEIWVREIVDLVWEGFRLRRAKANLLTRCARAGVRNVLWDSLGDEADDVLRKWGARDEAAQHVVDAALADEGLSLEAAAAGELWRKEFDQIERLDRMITTAELRRQLALHELERHRTALAQLLQRAIADAEEVEDAEYKLVAPAAPAREAAE